MMTFIQADITLLDGSAATELQIITGKVEANIETAKEYLLLEMKQLLMVNESIHTVSTILSDAILGNIPTGQEGDVETEAFMSLVIEYFEIISINFLDVKITSLALMMVQTTVTGTFTDEQIATLETQQVLPFRFMQLIKSILLRLISWHLC